MNATQLKDRIRLRAPVKRRLPSGQEKTGWSDAKPAHAKVEYLGARTYTAALAEQTGCSVRATVRRRPVAHGWRVELEGGPFKVKTVEPHKQRGYLVLMLERDDGNG
ncbi:phage head closure protein [Chromobacterium haemolyticum]|uniref:phage head closure protein n=1 Tax=Chromobacterium haemolyticum TaxID=394935 RepID=UPI0009DAF28F|nr:phage head closure protein [Chromobacterium haemolyticum]OQS41824.1 hypothetical protein B0T39_07760 [Chromobacterium haemolyticum]